jgi:phosphoribosyl 1,2-cyclic phosphodiesterase
MEFRFWGTRGSIPVPGPSTLRYGGNTPCCEVRSKQGDVVIIDAGTGICQLGRSLLKERAERPLSATLLLTHTHWDHIQGFPFFGPLFRPEHAFDIYGPQHSARRLESLLEGQLGPKFSPVAGLKNMGAKIAVHEIGEGEMTIGSLTVKHIFVPHTTVTLCYRFEEDGKALVFATDLEYLGEHAEAEKRRMARYFEGAEILIHDGMFTDEEYPRFKGWGHATTGDSLEMGRRGGVRDLYIYHHDPNRDDDGLERVLDELNAQKRPGDPAIFLAREGDVLKL